MEVESLRQFCLSLPHTTESFPFDEDILVFKVAGKMFCAVSLARANSCNVKGPIDHNIQLREQYEAATPGYHMDKKHWNTLFFNMDMPDKEILNQVKQSHHLVFEALPKKVKAELNSL